MTVIAVLVICTFCVAWANGANDNFKGVATLYGSGTLSYRQALLLATVATFLGSCCSIFLAGELVKAFSGKGIVPVAGDPVLLLSVAAGSAATVFLATFTGFPISTTHSLIGGLCGAALVAFPQDIQWSVLGGKLMLPLLLSPVIAIFGAGLLYVLLHGLRKMMRIEKEYCLCIGQTCESVTAANKSEAIATFQVQYPELHIDSVDNCQEQYRGSFVGLSTEKILDSAHIFSACLVCFARGLNDTPKILGLLVALSAFQIDARWGLAAVAVIMAIGGVVNARRVAETLGKRITNMNRGQGLVANMVTGFLVTVASRFGMPVSTTHVSVGALFGIGVVGGGAHVPVILQVLLSWLLTLPIAAIIAALCYAMIA